MLQSPFSENSGPKLLTVSDGNNGLMTHKCCYFVRNIAAGVPLPVDKIAEADLLYGEIDRNPLFEGTAAIEDRSNMNVTFLLTDESKEEEFNKMWNEAGINGLKGHRSVGGYRASMYNAMPIESVQVLVDVMKKLEQN